MKILHVSTRDIDGGAALAAYRLHRAMQRRAGCSSAMLALEKSSTDPSVLPALPRPSTVIEYVRRRIERSKMRREHARYAGALAKLEVFSDVRGLRYNAFGAQARGFDIIQLHWISRFMNYRHLFGDLPPRAQLVWRLPDMSALTGGCHYDGDCGRFAGKCGSCPQLESRQEQDLSRSIWREKQAALRALPSGRLHFVALNEWMASNVRRSSLFSRFDCTVIPNGVDLTEFAPMPPGLARAALNLPAGKHVVAFVADSATNVRKGFHLLLQAVTRLANRDDILLLIVGRADTLPPVALPSVKVGKVESVEVLRHVYAAADLFVIPSLEDNQPNTVLEAMACGTPVVGFRAGGIPEMVEHGRTGLLATRADVPELAGAIEHLLDHESERIAMGTRARERVEACFSRDRQVDRYLELYSRLIPGLPQLSPQPAGLTAASPPA